MVSAVSAGEPFAPYLVTLAHPYARHRSIVLSQDPRRLPKMTYAPRVVLFGYAGIAVFWAAHETYSGPFFWLLLALQFAVWPQLAYVRAGASRNP